MSQGMVGVKLPAGDAQVRFVLSVPENQIASMALADKRHVSEACKRFSAPIAAQRAQCLVKSIGRTATAVLPSKWQIRIVRFKGADNLIAKRPLVIHNYDGVDSQPLKSIQRILDESFVVERLEHFGPTGVDLPETCRQYCGTDFLRH